MSAAVERRRIVISGVNLSKFISIYTLWRDTADHFHNLGLKNQLLLNFYE